MAAHLAVLGMSADTTPRRLYHPEAFKNIVERTIGQLVDELLDKIERLLRYILFVTYAAH